MKTLFYFFLASVIFSSCTGISGSGNIVKETRKVGSFTGISASVSTEVEVRIGATLSIVVEADDNIISAVRTEVENGILEIGLEDNISINRAHIKVVVTAPYLTEISASSSADVTVIDLLRYDGDIKLEANSSASIKLKVDASNIEADASSSGSIEISGRAINANYSASSSGDVEAFKLECETVIASASSSGDIEANASKSLKAEANSSGSITYKGNASVEKDISSSGSVDKQ